jgi:hypothetical protein
VEVGGAVKAAGAGWTIPQFIGTIVVSGNDELMRFYGGEKGPQLAEIRNSGMGKPVFVGEAERDGEVVGGQAVMLIWRPLVEASRSRK